jgi:hypothetical protein
VADPQGFEAEFSGNRLHGEQPPHDLSLLLKHRHELAARTGIVLHSSADWAPWLDTSYLKEKDWANPDIRANVKAISEVCKFIDFIIEDEDRNFLGYWRGPARIALSQAPIVCLDNEGQFEFCGTTNVAGAILSRVGSFEQLRPWLEDIGIASLPSGRYDLVDVQVHPSPRGLHDSLYEKYSAEERDA